MIEVSTALPAVSTDCLNLYYTKDVLLGNLPVLVFYGPSTISNSTHNTSRIQAHIYSLAGAQSFPRLTIAPTSPLYAAVNHLPVELQGEEIYRGLAVSLLSYFAAIPKATKTTMRNLVATSRPGKVAPMMFDEMHAGDLAAQMVEVERSEDIAKYISSALSAQAISWVDMDVSFPPGTIKRVMGNEDENNMALSDGAGLPVFQYGPYSTLIDTFGAPAFLPTTKLRRAPSRPTARSNSQNLSRDQKISLRREMCEFVDTEGNYLHKIEEVIDRIAPEFRQKSESSVLDALFPQSLSGILTTNSAFLVDIQTVLEATENEAINDIESSSHDVSTQGLIVPSKKRDPTGVTTFAKTLVKWFPKFTVPYQDYLRTSSNLSKVISQSLEDSSTSISKVLGEFGEQRLRSMLIEPVQRLPRYSLLIDNMANLLPASHPAMASLLKARDIITDICALDNPVSDDSSRTAKTLRNMIHDWPKSLSPKGRLTTALDIVELQPPYDVHGPGTASILLLFPTALVILQKTRDDSLSAKGVMAEVDRPVIAVDTNSLPDVDVTKGIRYSHHIDLSNLRVTESGNGRLINISQVDGSSAPSQAESLQGNARIHVFLLLGPYDQKAPKLSEEIAKAKIEGRFSDAVRDSGKWALRSTSASSENVGILAALIEENAADPASPSPTPALVHLSVDGAQCLGTAIETSARPIIAAHVTTLGSEQYSLRIRNANGDIFTDGCTSQDLIDVMTKRVEALLVLEYQSGSPSVMQSHFAFDRNVLEHLPIHQQPETKHRSFRPISPVKMISNILGSSISLPSTPSKSRNHAGSITKTLSSIPALAFPHSETSANYELKQKCASSKVTLVGSDADKIKTPLELLEDTFMAYVVAIRSRSGNVVGKILRNRMTADELAVNELYNSLLEDPSGIQAAAEVSIDVLFAAFEKFLRRGWRERMGPLIPPNVIQNMQASFDSGKPTIFAQQVKKALEELSPQNRRAFAATVKLLADLLDASGNDGDRGVLIASFAEALVLVGDPHDYITLLDRLVDDYDNLFDEPSMIDEDGQTRSAASSLTRKRSANTGSVSSNTSSMRRKFGLGGGLSRENSKKESESKVSSIWRSLSKNSRAAGDDSSQPPSLSKASLIRSRSTDTDPRMLPPTRPGSRDRPTTSESTPSDEPKSRPGSAHLNMSTLSSIGEDAPIKPVRLTKTKRRSSLSDLKAVQRTEAPLPWYPLQPRKPNAEEDRGETLKERQKLSSPIKYASDEPFDRPVKQASNIPSRFGSPRLKGTSPSRDKSPSKENSPSMLRAPVNIKRNPTQKSEEVTITTYSPRKRMASRSNIPSPKQGLSERAWPPNGNNTPPKKAAAAPQKLRMQSPQKLRERLSQEQKALATADGSLQAEINKISEEMSAFKHPRPTTTSPLKQQQQNTDIQTLTKRLSTLSQKLSKHTTDQTAQTSDLRTHLSNSLLASEKKAKELDKLYKEANAENEALYERFNDELSRILGKVRKGEGVEEMKRILAETQAEVGRLKGENGKLKREVVGLRSAFRSE